MLSDRTSLYGSGAAAQGNDAASGSAAASDGLTLEQIVAGEFPPLLHDETDDEEEAEASEASGSAASGDAALAAGVAAAGALGVEMGGGGDGDEDEEDEEADERHALLAGGDAADETFDTQRDAEAARYDAADEAAEHDFDELAGLLEDEVRGNARHVLSNSWSDDMSIRHVAMDDDPDTVMEEDAYSTKYTEEFAARARRNSEPLLWEEDSDSDSDYLADDAAEAIWERFSPYGRVLVRRVRPVMARGIRRTRRTSRTCCSVQAIILCLVCIINFGNYLNYDLVGALNLDIKKSLHVDDTRMGVLYSVYTFPNIVVVLLGGMLIDRVGLRMGALLFVSLVVTGCTLVALAESLASSPSIGATRSFYWLAVFGRFVYGLGGESLYVAADAIVVDYFDTDQLSRAMTFVATFLNLGDLTTYAVMPRVAARFGVSVALWAAAGACTLGMVAVICYILIDKFVDDEEEDDEDGSTAHGSGGSTALDDAEEYAYEFDDSDHDEARHKLLVENYQKFTALRHAVEEGQDVRETLLMLSHGSEGSSSDEGGGESVRAALRIKSPRGGGGAVPPVPVSSEPRPVSSSLPPAAVGGGPLPLAPTHINGAPPSMPISINASDAQAYAPPVYSPQPMAARSSAIALVAAVDDVMAASSDGGVGGVADSTESTSLLAAEAGEAGQDESVARGASQGESHASSKGRKRRKSRMRLTLMERVVLRLKVFDARFYFLALTASSLTGAYTTFAGFAPDYLEKRFDYTQTDAGTVASFLSVANIISTPLLGFLFHRMRQVSIGLVVSFSLALMSCSHIYLAYIPKKGWPCEPAVVLIGFAFSMLAAALWPTLPLVVRESHTGTAYGVLYAVQNLVDSSLYYATGHLIYQDTFVVSIMWASIAALGVVWSMLWNIAMTRTAGGIWASLVADEEPEIEVPAGETEHRARK